MDGELSSTPQQRLAGKICALCRTGLLAPQHPDEQFYAQFAGERALGRRVTLAPFAQDAGNSPTNGIAKRHAELLASKERSVETRNRLARNLEIVKHYVFAEQQ